MTATEEKLRSDELIKRKKECFEWAYKIIPNASSKEILELAKNIYTFIYKISTDD